MIIEISMDGIIIKDTQEHEETHKRDRKGKSLLTRTKDFTAIDLETTGLYPKYDEIIELAAVRYRNGVAVDTFQQLINPGYEIGGFITKLTGITNDMLEDAPKIEDVLQSYVDFLGDDILVGHNVNFDINFIYDNCVKLDISPCSNCFIDTMRIAKRMYKDWPNHKLNTLTKNLHIGAREMHRGANDAELAAQCYLMMSTQDSFESCMKPAKKTSSLKAKDITAHEGFSNENSQLYGRVCVFTGALESFTRRDAMQIVTDIGGVCEDNVTKRTNLLILGNNDYCTAIKDGKSRKQKKAEELILKGADLQIIPEAVFLDMLSEE